MNRRVEASDDAYRTVEAASEILGVAGMGALGRKFCMLEAYSRRLGLGERVAVHMKAACYPEMWIWFDF